MDGTRAFSAAQAPGWLVPAGMIAAWGEFWQELPGRLAARPAMTALLAATLAVLTRVALEAVLPGVVPFFLFYLAITAATLLAGRRSGVIAVILCQIIVLTIVVPASPHWANTSANLVGLALSAATQLLIVYGIGEYRRLTVRALEHERLKRAVVELAMRELDHRTKNNFHLAIGILRRRSGEYSSPELREELDRAAQRLLSLEAAHANLAVAQGQARTISFRDYLVHMISRLREGLDGANIEFVSIMPDLQMERSRAVSIGLILNEIITNSAKHAFAGRGGTITIQGEIVDDRLVIQIADDGPGLADPDSQSAEPGLGQRLLLAMAESIDTRIERLDSQGAPYRITVPLNAG